MTDACHFLEALIHQDIPLTRAMRLSVRAWDGNELRLAMPLAANSNHKGTMFGGSLYSLSVLAGWGWLTLRLRDCDLGEGHIVIKGGQIEYPLPVADDAVAICAAPSEEEWEKFINQFRRRGRARLYLDIRIPAADGADAVRLRGEYVLHR
ncbi:MAG TPA: thioesterase domain-containing protein [Pseudomonas sp.]|nr:thioesterase domain-containing protein [Pseudomonas sp.]